MFPFLTYLNTLRYLKPKQIYRRIWFKLIKPRPNKTFKIFLREISGKWVAPISKHKSLLKETTFYFLNQSGSLTNHGWDDPRMDKLWRYNQHYFDDLTAENAEERRTWHVKLLKSWIKENIPFRGSGWEPYPCSLRIVNWIKWHFSSKSLSKFPTLILYSLDTCFLCGIVIKWICISGFTRFSDPIRNSTEPLKYSTSLLVIDVRNLEISLHPHCILV